MGPIYAAVLLTVTKVSMLKSLSYWYPLFPQKSVSVMLTHKGTVVHGVTVCSFVLSFSAVDRDKRPVSNLSTVRCPQGGRIHQHTINYKAANDLRRAI